MSKNQRTRIIWTGICAIGIILGLIDFYLSWIHPLKIFDVMRNYIFIITGAIGAISLCVLWCYWKVIDFVEFKKQEIQLLKTNSENEIQHLKTINNELIKVINNHADCLDTKTNILSKPNKDHNILSDIVKPIYPLKFNLDEFNRDFKQV